MFCSLEISLSQHGVHRHERQPAVFITKLHDHFDVFYDRYELFRLKIHKDLDNFLFVTWSPFDIERRPFRPESTRGRKNSIPKKLSAPGCFGFVDFVWRTSSIMSHGD